MNSLILQLKRNEKNMSKMKQRILISAEDMTTVVEESTVEVQDVEEEDE